MYLNELREQISQGDIFDNVPIAYVTYEDDTPKARVVRSRAIVLSHDCEYDKPNNPFAIVATVLPLTDVHPNSQGNIRHYKTRNTFCLSPVADKLHESFVAFRSIDRVDKQELEQLSQSGLRLASLTDEAREALQRQIAIFFGLGR